MKGKKEIECMIVNYIFIVKCINNINICLIVKEKVHLDLSRSF